MTIPVRNGLFFWLILQLFTSEPAITDDCCDFLYFFKAWGLNVNC